MRLWLLFDLECHNRLPRLYHLVQLLFQLKIEYTYVFVFLSNFLVSREEEIDIGTPQGSRLSPLLFIILMADLDLWTENSTLSNFADDTQSIIGRDDKKKFAGNRIK